MSKNLPPTSAPNPTTAVPIYRWPLMLGGLFLAFLLFSSWSVYQAVARVSPVVDHDYYARGQGYHEDERAWQAAAEAGWQLLLSRDGELLQVRLLDGDGGPVADALLTIRASRRQADNSAPWLITLAESAPGVYQARVASLPAAPAMVLSVVAADARLERRFKVSGASNVGGFSAEQWRELAL